MNNLIKLSFILLTCLSINTRTGYANISTNDSVKISLLTCGPGEEVYSVFGHTAIRYQDFNTGFDLVYNYGMFSFNTPNFIFRFVKGETDYLLGVTEYKRFIAEYDYYNRAVWEQTLNLTPVEKNRLFELLQENCRPENRTYRYNFFYDNCSTRPRDKIEESISGIITYPASNSKQSFRDIVREYTRNSKWYGFGMDFCLGAKADKTITDRQKMFVPLYLMKDYASATIIDSHGDERPLVTQTTTLLEHRQVQHSAFPVTPLQASLVVLILTLAITIYGIKKKRSLWAYDLILFLLAGLAGCVIAFLTLFSEHPAVDTNYLLFVFHPFHILFLPFVLYKEAKCRKSIYHTLNFIVLTLFILLWPVIPQSFDFAILPLAFSLLIRSANNLLLTYKKI